MLELTRADIGFGRVIVDERGVRRSSPFSSHAVAWDDIQDYRLTIELIGATQSGLVHDVTDIVNGYRGQHTYRVAIKVIGERDRVEVTWRFRRVELAVAEILLRVRDRMLASARHALDTTGTVTFGPLELTANAVRWNGKELAHAEVEAIELFNSSPISLRVMARARVWPHGKGPTSEIPNLLAALELAASLGYLVRGRELLEAVLSPRRIATVVT